MLADPVLRAQVQELFAASQVQTRLVHFLKDPALQEVSVQLLAQPEMAQAARSLFQSQPDALPAAATLLSQPTTSPPLLEILTRPEMQAIAQQVVQIWSDQAASPDEAIQRLATLLQTSEGRAVLNQTLEAAPQQVSEWLNRLLTSDQTPANTEALTRFLTLPAVQKALPQFLEQAPPETAARLLTTIAEKAPTPVAQTILKYPAIQAQIPRLLSQPETAAPLLRLLARPDLQEESSRALQSQTQSTAQALEKVLTQAIPRSGQPITTRLPQQPPQNTGSIPTHSNPAETQASIRTTLELLSRPELAGLARQVVSNNAVRQAVIQQLATPQTAAPILATLARPEAAQLARLILAPSQNLPSPTPGTTGPAPTVTPAPVSTPPAVPQTPSVPPVPSPPQPSATRTQSAPTPQNQSSQPAPPKPVPHPTGQALEGLLDLSSKPVTPQAVQQAAQVLQIAQQPGLESLAQTLAQSPVLAQNTPAYLAQPLTRDAWVSLLTQPAQASETQALLAAPGVRNALANALAAEGGTELAARLLDAPATARALIETLASSQQLPLLDRVLSQPAQQDRLATLLSTPETRDVLLPLLARPEMQATARLILQSPTLASEIGRQIENSENRATALQIITQATPPPAVSQALAQALSTPKAIASLQELLISGQAPVSTAPPEAPPAPAVSTALKLLAQPEMADVARQVFEAPEARQVLIQVLKQTSPVTIPESPDSASSQSVSKPPEEVTTILRILTQPNMIQTARALFSQPEAREALNQALSQLSALPGTPSLSRTDTAMLLDILSQPEMAAIARQAFSATDARTFLARVLSAPALPTAPQPTTDSVSVLRILARPEMARVAQDVLARPEVMARIPELLSSATTRAATLEVLARPELSNTVRSILESPEAQTTLVALLGSDKTQRQAAQLFDNLQLAKPLLSALASVKNSPQQTTLLENPHVQNFLAKTLTQEPALRFEALQILSQARTPAPAEQLLTRPEVRALLPEMLESSETRPALLNILSRLNQQPQPSPAAQNLLNSLQDPRITEILKNSLLTTTATSTPPPPSVSNPPTPSPATPATPPTPPVPSSTAHPASPVPPPPPTAEAEIALRLLARIETASSPKTLSPELAEQNLAPILRQSLQNPALRSAVLDILARPQNGTLAREVLSDPETQQALREILGLDMTGKTVPSDSAPRISATELQTLARALSQPETARQTLELLGNDPSRLARLVEDLANRVSTRAALDLLTRPDLKNLWSAAEKNPEIQRTLEKLLLSPEAQNSLRALLRQPDRALPLLDRLAQPENIQLAARLFERPQIQSAASSLLAQPETREPFLRLLSQPALADAAVRILNQPNVQEELNAILQDPSTRALLRPLLEKPVMTDTLIRILQNATQTAPSDDIQQFIQNILQTLHATNTTGTPQSQNSLFNLSLNQALARYGATGLTNGSPIQPFDLQKTGTATISDATGSLPQSASTSRPQATARLDTLLRQTFGLSAPEGTAFLSETTLQQIEASLAHLSAVSPARAQNALRALLLLGLTETPELNRVIEQIAQRLEGIATQLAQKGGLPIGQTEPALSETPLLPLRFGSLSSEQLGNLVRTLSQNGVEIRFAGRDASGNVQLHLLLGDLPAGSAERSSLSPNPSVVRQSNLTPDDLTVLRQGLGESRVIEPAQPAIWSRTAASAEAATPARPEILLAATALRDGERTIETLAARAGNPANPLFRPEAQAPSILPAFMSAFFPWFKPDSEIRERAGGESPQETETPHIPSMLELVLEGPLLLSYEPGELMIPGTDIPLILPPDYWDDGILDVWWEPIP